MLQSDCVCFGQEGVIGEQRLVDPPSLPLQGIHSRNAAFRKCQFDVELAYEMRILATVVNATDVDDLIERLEILKFPFKLGSDPYVQLVTTYQLRVV